MAIHQLAEAVRAGAQTAVDITEAALERVHALDGRVGAFVHLDGDGALASARALDEARDRGDSLGPLAGVPVTVKDLIAVAGQPLTAGSRMLAGYVPPADATVVTRLRDAGAVILGKVSLDEFAMGSTNETASQGPVHNPWRLDRVPGGSSGGSAAAVAAGFGLASLGTDTGGSVRLPAALCGVVGVKPTYGRVSRSGVVAYASSLDQVGPLATSVADAALVLQVIAGPCAADATSVDRPVPSWSSQPDVAGLRVGIVEAWVDHADAEVAAGVRAAAAALEQAGATVTQVDLPHIDLAVPAYYLIAMCEASTNLARYDGVRYGHRAAVPQGATLEELIRQSRAEGFGPEVQRRVILGAWALSSGYYEAYYDRACRARRLVRDGLMVALTEVDLLLGPTSPQTAWRFGDGVEDPIAAYQMDLYTTAANLAGLPALSLPWGLDGEGLPLAVQLHAGPWREDLLFRAGATLEQAAPPLPDVPTALAPEEAP